MRKRGSAKTSARSRPALQRKNTSARSSSSKDADPLRQQVAKALEWADAHVDFERVVEGVPADARGRKPQGLPYSLWQLLEHLRLSQRDILEFCRNPKYVEMKWPDDYWPKADAPPDAAAWDRSIAEFRRDRTAVKALAIDPDLDLFATIPHGSGQTYLRELLLIIDHNAYHIGEMVAARRIMGLWR
jgi:DinB family protein